MELKKSHREEQKGALLWKMGQSQIGTIRELRTFRDTYLDKTRLLLMADAWLKLAERNAELPKRRSRQFGEHPLVREVSEAIKPNRSRLK
jgi:hypothetical protein